MKQSPVANVGCDSSQSDSGCVLCNRSRSPVFHLGRLVPIFLLSLGALLVTFFWLLGDPLALRAAGPHYVAPNGVDSLDCTLSNPCLTIQQAISNAVSGDEIRVAAGRYTTINTLGGTSQGVYLNKSLTLRGGFTTTNWVTPDPDQNPTIIDAQGAGRVIYVPNAVTATVVGLHLTNGSADFGAGVYNENEAGALIVEDCQIYENEATGGGGVASNGTLILRGSRVYSNTTGLFGGGGVNVLEGTALIEDNRIFGNTETSASTGGGIQVSNDPGITAMIQRNVIFGNVTSHGGGVVVLNGDVTLANNLIYDNTASGADGGGVYVTGTVRLENNTIYDNLANGNGGGIYAPGGTVSITNTLIISNVAGSGGGIHSPGLSSIVYGDLFGNSPNDVAGGMSDPTGSNGNTSKDPEFVDAPNYDLHLSPGSPAIDTGTESPNATVDYEGNGRPFGDGIDRGADEYTAPSSCYARLDNSRVYTAVQAAVDAGEGGSLIQVTGHCSGVQVREGVTQTVYISKNLTVRGGYTVTNWTTPRYGPTILDAQEQGRVIYITGTTTITLENLHVTNGRGDYGAGIYVGANVTATLQNNVVYCNEATQDGGGVYKHGGSALLQHNTIYSNTASLGGGVYALGVVTLSNTIVASNQGNGVVDGPGGSFVLSYNDFYGNTPSDYGGTVTPGATDISVPPGLVDPDGGDFHLTLASQVINMAAPASALAADFEDDSRPQGSRSDIGADESLLYAEVALSDADNSPVIVSEPAQIEGQAITFTHTITNLGNTGGTTDSIVITVTNSDGWNVTLVGIASPVVLATGTSLTFDVVVTVPSMITLPVYNRTAITATSEANVAARDTALEVVVSPGVELAPSYYENADPGEVVTYTHTLTNTGPVDTFAIDLSSPLGWGQLITPTGLVSLEHGETTLVVARVRVTDTAAANLADVLTVKATSGFSSDVFAVVTDTTVANPTTGDRYVAPAPDGDDTQNNCTQPSSPCNIISYAVNQAAWGDAVLVAQGIYYDSGIFIKQDMTLRGGYEYAGGNFNLPGGGLDPTTTVIDAQNSDRCLRIQVPLGYQPLIEGFTIKNAASSGLGGAVYVQGSSAPALTSLIILDSTATRGGGIYIDAGDAVLQDIMISGTVASDVGGGVFINSGSALVQDFDISYTTAASGGAIYLEDGNLTLESGRVCSATATTGGGIYNQSGNLAIQGLWITRNTASAQGGGVYHAGGTLTISQTRVSSNTASAGGGLYDASGNSTLWNNFIYSNTASTGSGGGVYKGSGTLELVNNTLYGNQASASGGGLFDGSSSSLVISNTVVVSNAAATGGGIYRSSGGGLTTDYNDVWNNTAASFPDSNVSIGVHSISADPLFVDAAVGDLHLSFGSPCVDTADPSTFLTLDIEGDIRPVNQGFDMGADELGGCLSRIERTGDVYGVLQDAVDAAIDGDVVQISGICRGVQPRLVNGRVISQSVLVTKNLTLEGGYDSSFANDPATDPVTTTLDAEGLGRVVVITGSVSAKISHLRLTGGDAVGLGGGPGGDDAGGGVYNYNNILRLEASVIVDNQATYGGGLYIVAGTLTLGGDEEAKRTHVVSNTATCGGGLYLTGG